MRHAILLLGVFLFLVSYAPQSTAREKRPPPETKRVQSVSKAVYQKLTAAQEALTAGNYAEAEAKLSAILKSSKLNDHEKALTHQTLGFVHSGRENYKQAIASFVTALSLEALPDTSALNIRYNLGQLYLLTEQYDEGIATLSTWFEQATNPGAGAFILMANAYTQVDDYANALDWAERGLARMEKPKVGWMRLGAQLNLHAERYPRAAHWLERIVRIDPNQKSDWLQLVATYGQIDQPRKALIALEVADRQGFLTKSEERVRLAQLYLFNGIPYKAGALLEKGIADGSIEATGKTWELLANAWTLAQEDRRARDPLAKAAGQSENGKLWLRLAQIRMDAEEWSPAEDALRKAISKGGLDDPGHAQLLLGITFFERSQFDSARTAFNHALTSEQTGNSARAWLSVIEGRDS